MKLLSRSLLSLLFLPVIVSSSAAKCKKMEMELGRILGTTEESVGVVGKLLGSVKLEKCFQAHNDSMDWYYDLLVRCKLPEVAGKMLICFVQSYEPYFEPEILTSAIDRKFKAARYQIGPGTPEHKIVELCLSIFGENNRKDQFSDIMSKLIKDGNLPVLKSFVQAGFTVPLAVDKIYEIESEPVEMAKYLFANGYKAEKSRTLLAGLFQSKSFETKHFEDLLGKGLLKSGVTLQIAMEAGRLDLATAAYEAGIRLPSNFSKYSSADLDKFFRALPPTHLAEHIVNQRAMKRINIMLENATSPKSPLYGVSKTAIIKKVKEEFNSESVQSILSDFFETISPRRQYNFLI